MQEIERVTYIAAPFFTKEQLYIVEQIEAELDAKEEPYFSPREYGVISGDKGIMTPHRIERIFDMNIRMMNNSFRMVAVTDDFDPGVMVEIGYFYSMCDHLITFSPAGYGANVMIAKVARTHARSWEELELALGGHDIDQEQEVTK
jgi:nucleoside 2-deoxyribosyltransferase